MFKVNNKDTRTTSMASFSIVSIVNFEQLPAGLSLFGASAVIFVPALHIK